LMLGILTAGATAEDAPLWNGIVVEQRKPLGYLGFNTGLTPYRIIPSGYEDGDTIDPANAWRFGANEFTVMEAGITSARFLLGIGLAYGNAIFEDPPQDSLEDLRLPDSGRTTNTEYVSISSGTFALSATFAYTVPGGWHFGKAKLFHRVGVQPVVTFFSDTVTAVDLRPFYQVELPGGGVVAPYLRMGLSIPVTDSYGYYVPGTGFTEAKNPPTTTDTTGTNTRNYQILSAFGPFIVLGINFPMKNYNFTAPRYYNADDVDMFGRLR
jgi:hypothetical protein